MGRISHETTSRWLTGLHADFWAKTVRNRCFRLGFFRPTYESFSEKITRTQKPSGLMKQIPCRTQRYQRSSLPLMTKILAWHPPLPPPVLKLPWVYLSLIKKLIIVIQDVRLQAEPLSCIIYGFTLWNITSIYNIKYTLRAKHVLTEREWF